MRKILPFVLTTLMMAAAPAAAAVIYSENFEDGVFDGAEQGYNLPGGLGGGSSIFHVTDNYPAAGNFALGFVYGETPGNTPNGTTFLAPTGTLYTPLINLPNGNNISLNFDVANFGRGDDYLDRFDIGVFVGGNHYVQASSYSGYAGPPLNAQIYPQNNGYNSMTAILDAFAGQAIRIYIHYSVISPNFDNVAGGRFDNLSITDDEIEGPPDAPEPGMIGLLGFGLAGLAVARRKRAAA